MKLYPLENCRAVIFKPGMPLKDWLAKQAKKPFALINASLYDMNSTAKTPTGTIIEDGVMVHSQGNGYGFGVTTADEMAFGGPWDGHSWKDYITGFTGIIQGGKYVAPAFSNPYVFDTELSRIGLGEKDGVFQIVVDDGVKIDGYAQNGIYTGLTTLINLDGGASRYLYYDGKTIYSSDRTPYNAIAFYLVDEKEEQPTDTTNSALVNYTQLSPNCNDRTAKIDTITIHHMACCLTVEACGAGFALASRKASSNYGIGGDGRIALYVPENKRSWCSSNTANDNRAVTIEVANSEAKDPWPVSNAAYNSLIELVADICKRNGIERLVWSDNKDDRIQHRNGCNMTVHRDFSATLCPGPYLMQRMGQIAEAVNAKLAEQEQEEAKAEVATFLNGKTNGIDVSHYQGVIDWGKVKAAGAKFAIIKAGEKRSYDKYAERNLSECNRVGIPCGVYWFSRALTPADAEAEANLCCDLCDKFTINYPVCYDYEYASDDTFAKKYGRKANSTELVDMAKAFLAAVEKRGYWACNYTNGDYLSRGMSALTGRYALWYAWPSTTAVSPNRSCGIWQRSDKGKIDGINGNVDLDVAITDYSKIFTHKPVVKPGAEPEPEPEPPAADTKPAGYDEWLKANGKYLEYWVHHR